jgi:hypothetical protein
MATFILGGVLASLICFLGPYLCESFSGKVAFALLFTLFGTVLLVLLNPVLLDIMGVEKKRRVL